MQNNQGKLSAVRSGAESFFGSRVFCYLAPFTALAAYLIYLVAADEMDFSAGYYELSYLFTYDHGFLSKAFVGEVVSWFVDTLTPEIIKGVSLLGSVLLLIASSLCFGSVLDKTRENKELYTAALVIIGVLCVAPFTFRNHFFEVKQDKFFWALALFAVYFSQFKFGIWLAPILCFAAMLINPIFMTGCMFLIAIILLQKCKDSGFAVKNIIICAVSYIGMIVIGIFSLSSGHKHGFATPDEMIDFYFSRYSATLSETVRNRLVNGELIEYFGTRDTGFFKDVFTRFVVEGGGWAYMLLNAVFFAIPLFALLVIFWKNVIKEEKDKFRKFIFLLCPATMVSVLAMPLLGWGTRFFFYSYVVQLGLILYYIANKNEAVLTVVGRVTDFCKEHILTSAAVLIYFAIFFK